METSPNNSEPTRRGFLKKMLAGAAAASGFAGEVKASSQEERQEAHERAVDLLRTSFEIQDAINKLQALSEEDIKKLSEFTTQNTRSAGKDVTLKMLLGAVGGAALTVVMRNAAGDLGNEDAPFQTPGSVMEPATIGMLGALAGMISSGISQKRELAIRNEISHYNPVLYNFFENLQQSRQPVTHDIILGEIKILKMTNEEIDYKYRKMVDIELGLKPQSP